MQAKTLAQGLGYCTRHLSSTLFPTVPHISSLPAKHPPILPHTTTTTHPIPPSAQHTDQHQTLAHFFLKRPLPLPTWQPNKPHAPSFNHPLPPSRGGGPVRWGAFGLVHCWQWAGVGCITVLGLLPHISCIVTEEGPGAAKTL